MQRGHTVTGCYHTSLWVCGQLVVLGIGVNFVSVVVTHEMLMIQ